MTKRSWPEHNIRNDIIDGDVYIPLQRTPQVEVQPEFLKALDVAGLFWSVFLAVSRLISRGCHSSICS